MKAILLAICLLSPAIYAQDAGHLSGKWLASFGGSGSSGSAREAQVEFTGETGSWQALQGSRTNPCAGRSMPVALSAISPDGFQMTVKRSSVVSGCADFSVDFKKVDENTYKGKFSDNGADVTIARR
jgi:hypothetical protein